MVQRLDCRIIKFLCRHCAAFSFCREVVKLAATRLIALHKNKGKSVAACLKSRTDYAQNPDKTQQGELVSSYECSPLTVDEEFMLSKRQYELVTGRRQKSDVIAYQIRQSFKPGEITAEEANKVGYELAMRFTKGKYKIGSIKEMQERVDAATARYHELGDSIKAAEARMTEIAVLRTHIVNYARTRPVYDAYRKAGYSKRFLEAHREEITLHKAAKAAFDEAGLKKLPKTKDLSIEYAELLKKKKEAYPDYRKAQDEMQELMKAQKNVEMFFAEEKDTAEKEPTR